MKVKCRFCEKEFQAVRLSAVFCSNKCRTYYNRVERTPLTKREVYITFNGVKQIATPAMLRNVAEKIESSMDFTDTTTISKETAILLEKKDYQAIFNKCNLGSEYKSLLSMIESDTEMDEKTKKSWRSRMSGAVK